MSKGMIFDQTGKIEVDCSGRGHIQLYAKIKKSSKYFAQNEYAKSHKEMGFPFPVTITNQHYMYLGGPGDRYRKEDLNIFVKLGDEFVRIA